MEKVVLFVDENGSAGVVIPTPEALSLRTVEEIALSDVPVGCPFKIVERRDLPEDWSNIDAWEVDIRLLTDGVGMRDETYAG